MEGFARVILRIALFGGLQREKKYLRGFGLLAVSRFLGWELARGDLLRMRKWEGNRFASRLADFLIENAFSLSFLPTSHCRHPPARDPSRIPPARATRHRHHATTTPVCVPDWT